MREAAPFVTPAGRTYESSAAEEPSPPPRRVDQTYRPVRQKSPAATLLFSFSSVMAWVTSSRMV